MWDDQIDVLTENFQVLRYDTRGHVGTDTPAGPYSIDLFVEDVTGLLDGLGIEKVHFIGISMGGFIGQLLAAKYPERVLSLALCDTTCDMAAAFDLWNERIDIAKADGIDALVDGTLARWFTEPFYGSDPAAISKIADMIRATGVDGFVNCVKAIQDMSQCHILADIKAPTIVIVGEEDVSCPVANAEILHVGIAGSRLVILKNAAHLPNIEQKSAFNTALSEFLKEQLN